MTVVRLRAMPQQTPAARFCAARQSMLVALLDLAKTGIAERHLFEEIASTDAAMRQIVELLRHTSVRVGAAK
jgi:hypothetical protein